MRRNPALLIRVLSRQPGAGRDAAPAKHLTILRIDEGAIREILARAEIGDFIGNYVQLRKRGADLVGLCPFHGEKTPSFHVHPDRGFFKCFGCGAGGDVIAFYQRIENLTFPEAARQLAKRSGLELEPESPAAARVRSEKEQINAANGLAEAFFHRTLRLSPEGAEARAYCQRRGLATATIESFKLGYALDSWDALVRELSASGVDLAVAAKGGLLKMGQHGYYDFYRNRLMIPTYATTGEVVAFGGRALDDSEPKYLNTSTTPVYMKGGKERLEEGKGWKGSFGSCLFALNLARRAAVEREAVIVVEGYFDCIMLHQAGLINAVASLGTAFTGQQAAELRRYAERIFLCFDADAAGGAATLKSIDVLTESGCTAYIVQLPPGEDPDSFVRTQGADAFTRQLETALPWIQFKLDREIAEIKAKRLPPVQAVHKAEQLVQALPRETWDYWRVYVANELGLAVDDLRKSRFVSNPANFAPRGPLDARGSRHVALAAEPPSLEREVLAALVDEPPLVAEYGERIPLEVFRDERYRRIYATLLQRRDSLRETADVFAAFSGERDSVELLATLQKPDRSSSVRFQDSAARRAHLDRVVEHLMESRLDRRLKELDARINELVAVGRSVPPDEKDEFLRLVEERDRRKAKRLGTRTS
jgi:DNA primase